MYKKIMVMLAVIGLIVSASVAAESSSFISAKPVWLEGREKEKNVFVGFRATIDGKVAGNAVLRLTGSTICRIFINGEFLGYGPARGPHGFDRVDEWPLKGHCKSGSNVIAIEVAGYNANSNRRLQWQ